MTTTPNPTNNQLIKPSNAHSDKALTTLFAPIAKKKASPWLQNQIMLKVREAEARRYRRDISLTLLIGTMVWVAAVVAVVIYSGVQLMALVSECDNVFGEIATVCGSTLRFVAGNPVLVNVVVSAGILMLVDRLLRRKLRVLKSR